MTKIKNTKKGMAKKTLSMSLVVAMLATSNVPVWAAEFSDGTDNTVAEAFTAEAEAPVVEENTTAEVATEVANNAVAAEVTFEGADSNNTIDWSDDSSKELKATVSSVKVNGMEFKQNISALANYSLTYAWKVNGVATNEGSLTTGSSSSLSYEVDDYSPKAADAGKTISLILMLKEYDGHSEKTIWSQEYGNFTVNYRQISDYVKVDENAISNPTYTGEEQKVAVPNNFLLGKNNGVQGTALTDESKYDVAYTASDFTNVTDDGITITLTPKSALAGYTGSLSYTYKIQPLELTSENIATYLEGTYLKTSTAYTGKEIDIKNTELKVVDKKSGKDLSSYIRDGEKAIRIGTKNKADVYAGKEYSNLTFTIAIPEEAGENYYTKVEWVAVKPTNSFKITERDLSTVDVSIKAKTIPTNGTLEFTKDDITFTDKETNEELELLEDVDVKVTDKVDAKGIYDVTISPKAATENVTGKASAKVSVVSASIAGAKFSNYSNTTVLDEEDYTGSEITKTAKQLGFLELDGKVIDGSQYDIVYENNVNAGTAKLIVKGKNSFEGSEAEFSFTINAASVSSAKANEYVEIIDTTDYSDYAESMGIVVKAKNTAKKEFTLVEGTDYTVKYDCVNNEVNRTVSAVITITNKNFKGGATSKTVTSTITAKALKDADIKLKETDFTYTGKAIEADFDVVIDGKIINPDLYTVSYTNNVNAGTATIKVTGKGDKYSDKISAKATYVIKPADASKLEGTLPSKSYKGYSLEVPVDEINVTLNGEKINVKDNFTVTYGENVEIGDGTVTLTPKNGNFTGSKTLTFKIVAELLKGGDLTFYDENGVKITSPEFDYDGTAHTFGKVKFSTEDTKYQDNTDFAGKLTEGTDYEIKYVDNVYGKDHVGAVLVIAKGKFGGAFEDASLDIKDGVYTDAEGNQISNIIYAEGFEIVPQIIHENNITISNATYAGGLPVKPQVSINVKGKTLVEGKDFEVIVDAKDLELNGNNLGTVVGLLALNSDLANATTGNTLYAVIKGLNGYEVASQAASHKWGIDKFDLANADVTVENGKVTVKCGRVDVESSEYTVEQADGKVTVTANKNSKNYTGSKTVSAATEDQKPGAPMISSVNVVGNKATVILSGESDGAMGYDYVISTDRDCINNKAYDAVNKNQIKTETTFNYVGQGTYYAYCHAWTRDENGKKVFSDWSNAYPFVVSAITPSQPTITSVSVKGSTVTVTYTESENATGYDVVLGTSSKKVNGEVRPVEYTDKLVKKNQKQTTVTFENVEKGTYYVGLHAYNRTNPVNTDKVFSQWSNVKKATVK